VTNINFSVGAVPCSLIIQDDSLKYYFIKRYASTRKSLGKIRVTLNRTRRGIEAISYPRQIKYFLPEDTILEGIHAVTVALFEYNLVDHNILLLHGSGIKHGRQSFLFTGFSGAGKTTLSKNAPKRNIVCDDVAILALMKDKLYTYFSPFDYGRTKNKQKTKLLLKKIYLIKKSKRLASKRLRFAEIFSDFINQDYLAFAGLLNKKQQSHIRFVIKDIKHHQSMVARHNKLIIKIASSGLVEKLYFPKYFSWKQLF
jgi:hypothetical protein